MTNFTLIGLFNAEKHLPQCSIILNRNPCMDKGVNKILKMIVAASIDDPEKTGNFMITHLPVGMLNSKNVISMFKYLVKQANSEIPEKGQYE